jgi:hypothetical protein
MPRGTLIQIRRGVMSEWTSQNPVLSNGEFGFETDTNRLKIGNGSDNWLKLNYVASSENTIQIKNNSGYAINKGQAVYITGYDVPGGLPTVELYSANNMFSEQNFLGLSSSYIPNGSVGFAIVFGMLSNVDTTGSLSNISTGNESWSNGDILYVSPYDYGKLTTIKPRYNIILVGLVLYSNMNGTILIRSFINPKFDQLNGIGITNPINSNLLKYNSSLSAWSNSNDIDGGIV